jgi:N-acyl-phosphatidylethanolamine-hydrolysing phospholipase D
MERIGGIAYLFPMKPRAQILALFISLLVLAGCSGYIQRMVTQSFGRIGEPIPDAPHTITTPILPNAKLAVSWVGHATVLIQIHDKLIITDPLFTNTIGMLVKRFVKPGLDPTILSKVDITLISHMHFDHFSFGSLGELPKNGALFVPDGLAEYTPDFGFNEVYELKPWDVIEQDSVRITAVPARHFNGRYGFDGAWLGNRGYTGYVIEYRGVVVFFAGDTGYDPEVFKEIGRRFKVDLALVPIAPGGGGAGGLGSRVHVSPFGAVKIFEDVGAKYIMPIHFGTMYYGSAPNAAAQFEQFRVAAEKEGVLDHVVGLEVGEQRVIY